MSTPLVVVKVLIIEGVGWYLWFWIHVTRRGEGNILLTAALPFLGFLLGALLAS